VQIINGFSCKTPIFRGSQIAQKGLKLAPESEYAPLAHFILADAYNCLGQRDKYHEELRKGRQLQQKLEKNNQKNNNN